jgi:hypothetical protein
MYYQIIQQNWTKDPFILWNIPTIIIGPDKVFIHHIQVKSKGKAIFVTVRSVGLWDVNVPTFSRQLAHRLWWGCQLHIAAALYPRYSFLFEAELTPGPQCSWKDQVNCKLKWPHQESNPLPSTCSIMPRPNVLLHASHMQVNKVYIQWKL